MTIRRRDETEARAKGFDVKLEEAFDWLGENIRMVLAGLGVVLVMGAVAAGIYEFRSRQEGKAQFALAQVEVGFVRAMGSASQDFLVSEPANAEQALKGRQEALGRFDAVVLEFRGSRAAQVASVRAAEMEVGLERWPDAEQRLTRLSEKLGADDALRAVALRLLGYAQEQQGRFLEAGESYAAAAKVKGYPARGTLLIAAGASFARGGTNDRAMIAFQEALSADPELAEQQGIVERLAELAEAGN